MFSKRRNVTPMIKRLVYLSSAPGDISAADVEKILETSRRNNARADLTGLLLLHDGCFFQALEGPAEEVDRIFDVIEADSRHVGVIVLECSITTERAFSDWSMGFVGASKLSPDQRRSLIDLASLVASNEIVAFTPSRSATAQIESFLRSFREFAPV
jgi:hypothetical protein